VRGRDDYERAEARLDGDPLETRVCMVVLPSVATRRDIRHEHDEMAE
jgi:hypothetical protein